MRLSLPCQVPAPPVLARSLCIPLALGKRGVQSLIMQPFGVVGVGCHICARCTPPSRGSEIKSDCRSKLSRTRARTPFCGVCRVMRQLEKQRWPSPTSHWPCAPWGKPIVVNLKRGSRELAAGRWETRIRAGTGPRASEGMGTAWMARKARGHLLGRESRVLPAPPGSFGGWLSARPTSLIRLEYRNVIVMMGSCRQQRASSMALDLLVSADVGRFPLNRLTARQTTRPPRREIAAAKTALLRGGHIVNRPVVRETVGRYATRAACRFGATRIGIQASLSSDRSWRSWRSG